MKTTVFTKPQLAALATVSLTLGYCCGALACTLIRKLKGF